MMMTTRPTTTTFAFGSSAATKQPISSSLSFKNQHQIKSTSTTRSSSSSSSSISAISTQTRELKKEAVKEITSTGSCSRRDAITNIGLCLAAATLFSQSQNSQAAELASTIEYTVTPSGLGFYDKVIGVGPQPTKGQLIKAHYVGKLENGKVFDSSYDRGKPLSFRVGVGEVIKGWDQGILGGDGIPPMLPGGKRSLKLPSDLAYGMRGAGCKGGTNCIIPPNSTLLFDVEFIGKA
ncbi:hypothetical protein MKW98_013313 [Papaver atlanticum]|uniref:peptidylprolyl isomerase n=1 Tax=Papaver atlanticum TaxID=357466 RepID=A0AAD4XKQ7_9MAGN|nr:hypothetical protein MKW98_013313 [Papaver atlanticum]